MYDVIIVGARCAGAPLARLLAREGARVLLLDRARFPSDVPRGHFIHAHGPRRLRDWGLLDRVAAACVPITEQLLDLGDFPLLSRNLCVDGVAWGYGPRRYLFDKILVDAAVESGVELREGFCVDDGLFDGDRLIGIRGRSAGGRVVEERATITVGADGRHSRIARAVRAASYQAAPAALCYYFSYWSGVDSRAFELYLRSAARRVIFAFRTAPDLLSVSVAWPIAELPAIRRGIEQAFLAAIDLAPDFAARLRAGRREARFEGAADLPHFYRRASGPGWALVGDAAFHKDPYLALGICDALRDAALLAEAIVRGLASPGDMSAALAGYERRRNEASADDYRETLDAVQFTPPAPDLLAQRALVRDDPHGATLFTLARCGLIAAPDSALAAPAAPAHGAR